LSQWKRRLLQLTGLTGGGFYANARAWIEHLPIQPVEQRFMIEQIDLARAPVHKELDDSLRAGPMMDTSGKHFGSSGAGCFFTRQKVRQRYGTESASQRMQKLAARAHTLMPHLSGKCESEGDSPILLHEVSQ
jgi:hypothetical protein